MSGGPDTRYVICDIGVAPAKGTAIVTFPSFADGLPDERVSAVMKGRDDTPLVWMVGSPGRIELMLATSCDGAALNAQETMTVIKCDE